jgi:hypothetical protein
MTLDGQPLTEEEWQAILNATQGLVLLKGKWVEVDSEKLKEVLSHWKKVQAETGADGVNAVLALAIPKSIGALWWNATHGDNYSLKASGNAFYADGGAGSNLSRAGQRFWTLSHAKVGSSLPVKYVPGTAVAVTLSVTPGSGVTTFTVEEQPPTGWTVSALNESGLWTAISGKIKWGPFLGSTARTLTYQVTPPSGTSGTVQFSGSADFDGVAVAITGQRQSTNEGGFGQ